MSQEDVNINDDQLKTAADNMYETTKDYLKSELQCKY